MRNRDIRFLLIGPASLVALLVLFSVAGLRLNHSPSLPEGIYRVSGSAGKFVEFCAPESYARLAVDRGYLTHGACSDGSTPLLKPVVARAGDVVDVTEQGILVNGILLRNSTARKQDSKGRGLTMWPYGKYPVSAGSLWVVSSYNARSFDSRYYGPIAESSVREGLKPVLVWE